MDQCIWRPRPLARCVERGLAGGGVHGGQVVGRSDAQGGAPADRPITPGDLLATMYHSLGIDPTQSLARPDGQPYRLVENGAVVRELFG